MNNAIFPGIRPPAKGVRRVTRFPFTPPKLTSIDNDGLGYRSFIQRPLPIFLEEFRDLAFLSVRRHCVSLTDIMLEPDIRSLCGLVLGAVVAAYAKFLLDRCAKKGEATFTTKEEAEGSKAGEPPL